MARRDLGEGGRVPDRREQAETGLRLLGLVALLMAGFFWVLLKARWRPGDPTGKGRPLHHAYRQRRP